MELTYEFNPNDTYRFATFIGTEATPKGDNLQFEFCPQCHGGKSRDKHTFSISLKDGRCQCLRSSCGYKGNMLTLARDFEFELTEDVSRYYNIKNFNGRFKKFKDAHRTYQSKDGAIEYLESRGIPAEVTKKYEITTKADRDGKERILVFPFKDDQGALKFIKYRNMEFVKGESLGSKEWTESNCMPILFGMNQCNTENETLIITEGQIDSLSVAAAGIENAVSVPNGCNGFTWIPHCWNWMHQFKELIVFGDREGETITLLDTLSKRVKLSIKHVRLQDYKDCKDANEILQKYGPEQIKACIENAISLPIKQIIELADVQPKDIFKMEKLRTGIKSIDRLLKGGLPFGGVTLLTGKAGEGKSTLGSQILLQAIEQEYKCFAYSGELPNYVFKEWLDFQAAGPGLIDKYQNDTYGDYYYTVPEEVTAVLNDWYRGKCFLYDNDITNTIDEETTTLCELIENAVMQYGVRVILLDNLMTALDLESVKGNDRYEVQSSFMKKITKLALKYDLCIILVAHKRKNQAGTNVNDEIAGSSDIANLGMITLSYEKSKEVGEENRLLKLTKNRLFGAVNTEGILMHYEPTSKRIYEPAEQREAISFRYGFEDPEYEEEQPSDYGYRQMTLDDEEDAPF